MKEDPQWCFGGFGKNMIFPIFQFFCVTLSQKIIHNSINNKWYKKWPDAWSIQESWIGKIFCQNSTSNATLTKLRWPLFCQAQFQSASTSQVELGLPQYHCDTTHPPIQPTRPTQPHLEKYIWAISGLPRKLKFSMEALLNQTRSSS